MRSPMRSTSRSSLGQPRSRRSRRGLAMLLVILSLAMATILTTSYLASRDNSIEIGRNVSDAAAARWAAESALDLTIAVLQTDSEWRLNHTNGYLMELMPLSGALVSVRLIDLETGLSPTIRTQVVRIVSTALVDGIRKTATAQARIRSIEHGKTAEVDLSEFAVFAVQSAEFTHQSLLGPWESSPGMNMYPRMNLGTQGTSSGTITIADDATIIDGNVFHGPGVSGSYLSTTKEQYLHEFGLDDHIPAPTPPGPGVAPPSGGLILDLLLTITNLLGGSNRYSNITLSTSGSYLRLGDNSTLISNNNLTMHNGAGILVEGKSKIVIFGNVTMHPNSWIELRPAGSLDLFVFGNVTITDAFIGQQRSNRAIRDNSSQSTWMDPRRLRIYSIPSINTGDPVNTPTWTLTQQSVVKATTYLPNANVVVRGSSALFGRATASTFALRENAALFYDPTLNRGGGYTNTTGPMYTGAGKLMSEFVSLSSLDADDLTALAASTSLLIKAGNNTFGTFTNDTDTAVPGDPTPRPIEVEYDLKTVDFDLTQWEQGS